MYQGCFGTRFGQNLDFCVPPKFSFCVPAFRRFRNPIFFRALRSAGSGTGGTRFRNAFHRFRFFHIHVIFQVTYFFQVVTNLLFNFRTTVESYLQTLFRSLNQGRPGNFFSKQSAITQLVVLPARGKKIICICQFWSTSQSQSKFFFRHIQFTEFQPNL